LGVSDAFRELNDEVGLPDVVRDVEEIGDSNGSAHGASSLSVTAPFFDERFFAAGDGAFFLPNSGRQARSSPSVTASSWHWAARKSAMYWPGFMPPDSAVGSGCHCQTQGRSSSRPASMGTRRSL